MPEAFAARLPSGVARALVAIAAIGCVIPSAWGSRDTPEKLVRTLMEQVDIPGSDEELRLFRVEIAPGYSVPAHRQPVAGVCYVIEGTAESQYEGEPAKVVEAGGSFHDEAGNTHVVFKNSSPTDALKFLCATKIKKGQPYLLPN